MSKSQTPWSSVPGFGGRGQARPQLTAYSLSLPSPGSIPHGEGPFADMFGHASQHIQAPLKLWSPDTPRVQGCTHWRHSSSKASTSLRSRFRGARPKNTRGPGIWSVVQKGVQVLKMYISSPHRLLTPWEGMGQEEDQSELLWTVGPEYGFLLPKCNHGIRTRIWTQVTWFQNLLTELKQHSD